jgi:hypothetical protein
MEADIGTTTMRSTKARVRSAQGHEVLVHACSDNTDTLDGMLRTSFGLCAQQRAS